MLLLRLIVLCYRLQTLQNQRLWEPLDLRLANVPHQKLQQLEGLQQHLNQNLQHQLDQRPTKKGNDEGTGSVRNKRHTRLSTGVIKAANYQSLLKTEDGDNDDDDNDDDDNDDDDAVKEEEYHASDNNFDPDDSDGADDDIDISKYIVSKNDKSAVSGMESKLTDKNVDNLNQHGIEILDPALQELTVPGYDQKKPFIKCKLCGDDFRLASQFQKHVASTHGDVVKIDKPYVCLECGKKFPESKYLTKHRYRHRNEFVTYRCTHKNCDFTFNRKDRLISHIQVHKGKKKFQCNVCGVGFDTVKFLSVHKTLHSSDKTHSCPHCEKTFTHVVYFREHLRWHKNANKFKCDLCPYTCGGKHYLKSHHMRVHEKADEYLECERCKRTFKHKSSYDNHVQLNKCKLFIKPQLPCDPDSDLSGNVAKATKYLNSNVIEMMGKTGSIGSKFKCKHCPMAEFRTALKFLQHHKSDHAELHPDIDFIMKTAFKCTECNQCFKSRRLVKAHLFTHSLDRPHKCNHPGCDKTFKNKEGLKGHGITHKEKQYMCSWCGWRASTKAHLNRHQNSVHLKLKPHQCAHCGKAFGKKGHLDMHERRIHLKLKKHMCEKCGRSFVDVSTLKAHMLYHTGEKPYKCDQCDYRCVRVDYLGKHKRTHSKEKPYQCKLCDMTFAYRTPLVAHEKRHHGIDRGGASAEPRDMFAVSSNNVQSSSQTMDGMAQNVTAESESKFAVHFLQQM
ncbi:uncharacterized protein [Amphiura filiformis]|uniref:uncharacterized protein n=1 Tax=Amphiura filiformis TaxID=82378 RepID=UPI003B2148A6